MVDVTPRPGGEGPVAFPLLLPVVGCGDSPVREGGVNSGLIVGHVMWSFNKKATGAATVRKAFSPNTTVLKVCSTGRAVPRARVRVASRLHVCLSDPCPVHFVAQPT